MSPMSTKPPIAVRMPRVTPRSFFIRALEMKRSSFARERRERLGQAREPLELASPRRDAQRGEVLVGLREQLAELLAEPVRVVVGRLHAVEGRVRLGRAFFALPRAAPTRTDRTRRRRCPTRAPSRAVSTDESADSAVSFALCS